MFQGALLLPFLKLIILVAQYPFVNIICLDILADELQVHLAFREASKNVGAEVRAQVIAFSRSAECEGFAGRRAEEYLSSI